ncbi:triacylglycerol lipase 2-like protein [Tanacetum coccineum]
MTYTISTVIITFIYLITISRAVRTLNSIKDDESFLVLGDRVGICSLLIEPEGYTCEEHKVTTKDGYILSMQRIPAARGGTKADKPPAYWEWSWDELVAFDLPSSIQYVHDQTGQKLHYVGHSLPCCLISPIAYLGQVSSKLARAGADAFLGEALYWLGLHEFAPRGKAAVDLLSGICKMPGNDCSDLMTSFTGQNCCLNSSMTDKFLEHEPHSTSTKNMIHLARMIRTGTITMYDYGNAYDNDKHYEQSTPPTYDMSSIPNDFPMYLSYGGADELSDVQDVKTLLDSIKDHDPDRLIVQYKEDYGHADFIFAVNAKEVVYDPVMVFFKLN